MCVTMHYVDCHWQMKSIVLDLLRFNTPHTSEAFATVMLGVALPVTSVVVDIDSSAESEDGDLNAHVLLLHGSGRSKRAVVWSIRWGASIPSEHNGWR